MNFSFIPDSNGRGIKENGTNVNWQFYINLYSGKEVREGEDG